jgi:hypothetical protein
MSEGNFDPEAFESRVQDLVTDVFPRIEFQLNYFLWLAQRHGCPLLQVDSSYKQNIHDGYPVLQELVVTRSDWLPDGKLPDEDDILFRAP